MSSRARTAQAGAQPQWAGVTPEDLMVLIRCIELGSMAAAARERNVPTSQVSRAIERLEQRLGARLLRRSTHGLTLTPEGVAAVAHGREVLGKLDDLADAVSGSSGRIGGTVRLSVSLLMAQVMVLPALPRLLQAHPGLHLALHTDDRLVDLPTEGIDVALRTSVGTSEMVVARRIGGFRRSVFASPEYLSRRGAPVTLDDLQRHSIVTHQSAGSLNRWSFVVDGQPREVMVSGSLSASSTWMMQQLILQGHGLARLSVAGAAEHLKSGRLVEVLGAFRNPEAYPLYVVVLPDRQRSPRIAAVMDFLTDAAKKFWAPLDEQCCHPLKSGPT
jgi:DNA-binding transcriptional LysR family regulator